MNKTDSRVVEKVIHDDSLKSLIKRSRTLNYVDRMKLLFDHFDSADVLVTSSFGVKSALLLHLISKVKKDHPIYFVDTGYHFPETIAYKRLVTEKLDLNVIDLYPDHSQHLLTKNEHWWEEHPKMCCTINKIAPLQPIIERHKLWVSNLMAFETDYRSRLEIYQKQGFIIKFHPFLDLNPEEYKARLRELDLETHPLFAEGYESIGCSHCTAKGNGRLGRWQGTNKTECGLHEKYFINTPK